MNSRRKLGNPAFYATLTQPQSLNKYQYAYNNPLRYVDPDGHQREQWVEKALDLPAAQQVIDAAGKTIIVA